MSSSSSPMAVPPLKDSPPFPWRLIGGAAEKKRRLRGTPGPDAEVVALSPPALLEWNRSYVCDACGRAFRRRRHHKHLRRYVLQRWGAGDAPARKRVFVCPEPGCEYHAPARALSDLPTLQNHFRRKHGRHGLWACGRGSSRPAVCADCKAHLTARDDVLRGSGSLPPPPSGQLLHIAAAPSGGGDLAPNSAMASPAAAASVAAALGPSLSPPDRPGDDHGLEMQLMPPGGSGGGGTTRRATPQSSPAALLPRLDLSLGLGGGAREIDDAAAAAAAARMMVEEAREQLVLARAEKAAAAEALEQARRRAEMAGLELASAQRLRQRAQEELGRAHAVATRQLVNARLLQLACYTAADAVSSTPWLPR
ncbi:unnamed protein product [Urochloa humidicola]